MLLIDQPAKREHNKVKLSNVGLIRNGGDVVVVVVVVVVAVATDKDRFTLQLGVG